MRTLHNHAAAIAVFGTVLISAFVFAASGSASPAADSRDNQHPIELSFTKWNTISPGGARMEGFVRGDVSGTFAGQALVRETSTLVGNIPGATGEVRLLDVVYEVTAGEQSFRALLHGGYDFPTNKARLDGIITGGWLAGENVHVEFRGLPCNPVQPNADGGTCFEGTITIPRDSPR